MDPAREDNHYWGEVAPNLRAIDIWIGEEADPGRGYGTEMMRLAFARCFVDPAVTAVLIDPPASNVRAHRFYERLGFRFVERRRFGDDDCFDLNGTDLEGAAFAEISRPEPEPDWLSCRVTEGRWEGAGAPHMLGEILAVFVGRAREVSGED
ncbi:MAG: Imm53 family immunity protein [Thermoleophilia bacterium]